VEICTNIVVKYKVGCEDVQFSVDVCEITRNEMKDFKEQLVSLLFFLLSITAVTVYACGYRRSKL